MPFLLLWLVAFFNAVGSQNVAEQVMLPMRDGVKLYTILDLEFANQTQENLTIAIMDRSPYGSLGTELIATAYAALDSFAGVRQDIRGTKRSEGKFDVFRSGESDSHDTFSFLVNQSWSNGKVHMVGASADGIATYTAIKGQAPGLAKTFIIWSTSQGYPIVFPGGAFRKSLVEFWMKITVPDQWKTEVALLKTKEDGTDPWWAPITATDGDFQRLTGPAVLWAGWYDIFLTGNLFAFEGVQKRSPERFKGQSRLFIDPCGHCQAAGERFLHKTILGRSLLPVYLSLYNFKDKPWPKSISAITFYVMGAFPHTPLTRGNYWTSIADWPDYTEKRFFLSVDSALTVAPSKDSSNVSFTYDPSDPVPTVGGNNLEIACGPLDQRSVEQGKRTDVLTFTSLRLKQVLAVTGPLTVELWVSSDAVDTDFTAKLTDVHPEGQSTLIQDGIVRMRWRTPGMGPQNMSKGEVYPIEISLWNTSYVWNIGHRIRVSISSSNSPRFEPNPNNGLPLSQEGTTVVARNLIHIGPQTPSVLVLPAIDLKDLPEVDVHTIRPPSLDRALDVDEQRSLLQRVLGHLPTQNNDGRAPWPRNNNGRAGN